MGLRAMIAAGATALVGGGCVCGGSTEPSTLLAIAVTGQAGYRQLVCDPGQGCPECAPLFPDTVEACCAVDGHCAVREATPACPPCPIGCPLCAERTVRARGLPRG